MKPQKGAALIVVLSLLTISLMVGLSSMQSSQIDERLAGNHKINSNLSMAAEHSGARAFSLAKDNLADFLADDSCGSDDFFLPIDSEGNVVDFDSDADIGDTTPPVGRNSLNLDWETLVSISTFESLGGGCADVLPFDEGFADGDCNDSLEEGASVAVDCIFRYVSLYDASKSEGERIERFIVSMARMIDGEGHEVGVSLPLFIEIEYPDINVSWLFDGPPINFLAEFDPESVKIAGANNMTLDNEIGAEISLPSSIYKSSETQKINGEELTPLEFFEKEFTDNQGAVPEINSNPELDIDDFVVLVEELRKASVDFNVPNIHYVADDPDMSQYDTSTGQVLVVADNFTWRGGNEFNGVIIVLGATVKYSGGGSGNLNGSLIHAPITPEDPDYPWVDEDGFVEFPEVEKYLKGEWKFGSSKFDFDFSGGGASTLKNDGETLDLSVDTVESAPGFAKVASWETE